MSLPTYDQFIEPILRVLQQYPEGLRAAEVHDAAADYLQLTQEQRSELLSSGQAVYKNRCGWAHDRLKRAGLSFSPRRGLWQLTNEGAVYASKHSSAIAEAEIQRIASSNLDAPIASKFSKMVATDEIHANASPDDQLEQALQALRQATADELLEMLLAVTPSRFEVIVLDVLHGLGYGISRQDLQRVGGSGDAGIDGVISLDKLGLEKVYVQAKRWQGTVGRPELQAFYGALAGQKAKRGVFITTSSFTAQALDFANSVEGIVLIDGERLVNLMMDTEVGVTSRTLKVPSLDSDYFE
ncbi:MAG: restriction endonuclease [Thiopseudomonas sp.]|nr:restriction endonuclease [Thiopseudomonas sp.]MCK9465947.1 restriction endonuclease [Thiopseudomonas sp.]